MTGGRDRGDIDILSYTGYSCINFNTSIEKENPANGKQEY